MNKKNFDDTFIRMVHISLIKSLSRCITWINYFSDKKIRVVVPFYMSMPGNERFALDAFVDDIPDSRVELNTDQIPRGVVTFNSFTTDVSQFANPNQYIAKKQEINGKMKQFIQKTKAIPVNINFEVDIVLATEIDVYKCSEKILNMLFNYLFFNIDYYGIKIDSVFTLPDDKDIQIEREQNMESDTKKHIKFPLTVHTYYPSFISETFDYIDTDDLIVCDNDSDIDWSRLCKKRPELGDDDSGKIRRVNWKNYYWDMDLIDNELPEDRTDTPRDNF